jgi:hypothetical protein
MRDEGIEQLSNMLLETSRDACRSAGVLNADCLVVSRNCVGATVACPGIAASAWPPCLGTGTVVQGAGHGN